MLTSAITHPKQILKKLTFAIHNNYYFSLIVSVQQSCQFLFNERSNRYLSLIRGLHIMSLPDNCAKH